MGNFEGEALGYVGGSFARDRHYARGLGLGAEGARSELYGNLVAGSIGFVEVGEVEREGVEMCCWHLCIDDSSCVILSSGGGGRGRRGSVLNRGGGGVQMPGQMGAGGEVDEAGLQKLDVMGLEG